MTKRGRIVNRFAPVKPQYIETIIAAISAVMKWMEDQKSEAARQAVSSQLQLLIDLMLQVLEELKKLRIILREELEAAFRTNDMRQLAALKKSIQDDIAGIKDPSHIPQEVLQQLETHLSEVKTLTYKLQLYGYAPYFAVVAGSLLTLQLAVLLRLPRTQILSIFDNIRKYYSDALLNNPALQPETVQVTLAKTTLEEAKLWNYVTAFPARGYLGDYSWWRPAPDPSFPPDTGSTAYYVTLEGKIPPDKSPGFRYKCTVEDVDSNGNERRWPSYPDLLGYSDDLSDIGRYETAIARVFNTITVKLAQRDDAWNRLVSLQEIIKHDEGFLIALDDFKKKIPKHIV